MSYYTYILQNLTDGSFYVGKTERTPAERLVEHKANAKDGQTHLYRAMRKHGKDNFVIKNVFTHASEEAMNLHEIQTIAIYRLAGHKVYNMTDGGDGGNTAQSP